MNSLSVHCRVGSHSFFILPTLFSTRYFTFWTSKVPFPSHCLRGSGPLLIWGHLAKDVATSGPWHVTGTEAFFVLWEFFQRRCPSKGTSCILFWPKIYSSRCSALDFGSQKRLVIGCLQIKSDPQLLWNLSKSGLDNLRTLVHIWWTLCSHPSPFTTLFVYLPASLLPGMWSVLAEILPAMDPFSLRSYSK